MSARLTIPPSHVRLPDGFAAGGIHCGLKRAGQLDLGLLLADAPVPVAALFTDNQLLGAHIPVCRDHLDRSGHRARAILVNARNANCSTGQQGIDDAYRCCAELASRLDCPPEQVLMASTGPIGAPLPRDRIIEHLDQLLDATGPDGGMDFARAIMTTDTHAKAGTTDGAARTTGFAKGSGMIHPNMATMLGFLLTDGGTGPTPLRDALGAVADRTFHRVTIDGDTSPNDSLFLMASGRRGDATGQMIDVATDLARQIAADGEGATRLMTIEVRGGPDDAAASHVGRVIATSPLVKTAVAGRDPNWGRLLAAAGRAGVPFDPARARVWIGATDVYVDGMPRPEREAEASRHLQQDERVVLGIDLGVGDGAADVWTCDLTADYVQINADYRT
ncbi:MAG: bifunctional glutamate N-acetyltransferase/amino-acid acetyltransferase ArgJ [Planctomycetes bacterium]|nr:bifunctional glutamate N-acetyltransferase/amino-acid acetyltransferase ArgJ [Planctomycetota bacterium]